LFTLLGGSQSRRSRNSTSRSCWPALVQEHHQIGHGRLSRDGDFPGPVGQCDKANTGDEHIDCFENERPVGTAAGNDDGNVLYVAAHEHVKLQNVRFQCNLAKEFERCGMQLGQVLAAVAERQPPKYGHPENKGMDWIVGKFVLNVTKEYPPEGQECNSSDSLSPRRHFLFVRVHALFIGHVGPLNEILGVSPTVSRNNAQHRTVLVRLESKVNFLAENQEHIDERCLVKQNVREHTNGERGRVALPVWPLEAALQEFGDVTRGHGNEKGRRVQRYNVKQVKGDANEYRQQYGKVIDAQPHGYGPFDGKVLLLVKIQKVPKASHPNVGTDKDANRIVNIVGSVVVVLHSMYSKIGGK
jgi:hypothetical protein